MAEPTTSPRVLVVDDETQMLSIVSFALQTQGFEPVTARNAEDAWQLLRAQTFDLVVLDVMLPGASGLDLCHRLRATLDTPVMLLTARTTEDDRVAGLLAGADDYLTKPFSPRELALRAQAIVRRVRGTRQARVLVNGPIEVDPDRREVKVDGRRVRLSDVELRLLGALVKRPGHVVTWSELLNEVWYTGEHAGGRDMIKTTVYRLRQHLGAWADSIVAVRGTGYVMHDLERRADR